MQGKQGEQGRRVKQGRRKKVKIRRGEVAGGERVDIGYGDISYTPLAISMIGLAYLLSICLSVWMRQDRD